MRIRKRLLPITIPFSPFLIVFLTNLINIAYMMNNLTVSGISTLDKADLAILRIVQKDNQITHAAIGDKIGLSVSAVRRRLVALRQDGHISKDVSILLSLIHI